MPHSIRYAALAFLASELLAPACGISFPARARYNPHKREAALQRRDTTGTITINDLTNAEYTSQITVGGGSYTVLLDTGSSDLNIEGQVSNAEDQANVPVEVDFAEGSETGVMSFATVSFAGHTVTNQIFNHVAQASSSQDDGLLGLGPSEGSVLFQTAQQFIMAGELAANAGDSVVDRIFQQDTTTPNFISFTLGRDDNANDNQSGGTSTFTVGDIISGFENISSMPQLDVITAPASLSGGQHFTILVDGATGNNGQPVAFPKSVVTGTPSGKLVAVLDSGFTFPQVVPAIATAFYGGISGAKLQTIQGDQYWTFPCSTEIDGAFTFSGNNYPIHPLDLNFDPSFVGVTGLPSGTCIGAFQPIQDDATQALAGLADMILGMAFLRNTYTLLNYGDFVDSTADARKPPFVQLLSVTNAATASNEFHSARGGTSSGGGSGGSSGSGSGSSPSSASPNSIGATIKKYLGVIIAVPAAIIALVLGLCIFCCVRRRRRVATSYQTLQAPAPVPYAPGGQGQMGYAPPYQPYGQYNNQYGAQPYGASLAPGGRARSVSPYADPFRDTSGPNDQIPLEERNAQGRFAHSPQPSRDYSHSPQPSRDFSHSPQPSFSSTAPYDPPQGPPPNADPYR